VKKTKYTTMYVVKSTTDSSLFLVTYDLEVAKKYKENAKSLGYTKVIIKRISGE